MPKVAILMGSSSDAEIMSAAEEYLRFFGIEWTTHVLSAHRTPEETAAFAKRAEAEGYSAIIAGAGMAAHLPGVLAAYTTLPIIGVPLPGSALNGVDALYSIVQMPAGVPVATMAIGKAGARNAAIFVAEMLALNSEEIKEKLRQFRAQKCSLN
ncbi:MAG: 5-(carboxyamino)imidazole ribonucleotide mutase [candidate division KSB1 bacterium]|nr:5-(carboxyamino)imidazole ribonucleotide mutase [candidate division KSB1 bacterium]